MEFELLNNYCHLLATFFITFYSCLIIFILLLNVYDFHYLFIFVILVEFELTFF